MQVAWKTDTGKKKKVNEDSVLVDEESHLFLLADGMSRPCAGNIASSIAVQQAHSFLKGKIELDVSEDDILDLMRQAVIHAHEAVRNASKKDPAYKGMGTTLLVLFVRDETAYLTHVGDSRAYRLRRKLEHITTDHTLENQAHHGAMLRELFSLQKARVLTQAVGPSKKLACDCHRVSFRHGDFLLLCTDGLTDMISNDAIEQIITLHGPEIEKTAASLVEAANRMGGRDNISAVVITR